MIVYKLFDVSSWEDFAIKISHCIKGFVRFVEANKAEDFKAFIKTKGLEFFFNSFQRPDFSVLAKKRA